MSGWVPMEAAWWPAIAESMAKPWNREAILFDLRWWADQERMGRAVRPGRPELARRWGVTDWTVKLAFKSEPEWADPAVPPADRQPSASAPPADRQRYNGTKPKTPRVPPADRQPSASAPPADRPARVEDTLTPITLQTERERHAPDPVVHPLPGDRVPPEMSNAAEINACMALSEAAGVPLLPQDQRAIRESGRSVVELALIWAWAHGSADSQARLARDNGWADRWKGLLKSAGQWLVMARAWDNAGRPTGPPARAAPSRPAKAGFLADLAELAAEDAPPEPT